MTTTNIPSVPISEIRVINPRPRNKHRFDQIIASIRSLGLKKPITVSEREHSEDGTQYDLICGQGRLEAFLALGESSIPAIIITASREDQFLMSLIENIARRAPSNRGLLEETKRLRNEGYTTDQIAEKLGFQERYIASIVSLLNKGEVGLLRLVEAGKIPITVAAEISQGTSDDVQKALTDAYQSGELRGSKLRAVRDLIKKRAGKSSKKTPLNLNGQKLAQQYREYTREQRELVKRATVVNERLMLLGAAFRKLFFDENFMTLLRAEKLLLLSEKLIQVSQEA